MAVCQLVKKEGRICFLCTHFTFVPALLSARRKVKPQKEDVEHPPEGPAAILQFLGGVKHQAVEIVIYIVVVIPARLLSTHQILRTPFNQNKKGKNKKDSI